MHTLRVAIAAGMVAPANLPLSEDVMDPAVLKNRLSDEERTFFQTHGYLVIPDAVADTERQDLISVLDRVDRRDRRPEHGSRLLSVTDVVQEAPSMVSLVDNPRVLPKVWGILGWNIYLYHSHCDITPSDNVEDQQWSVAWHQDSMRVNDEIESVPRPRLSLKVGYYLTDVSQPLSGNTLIVPGSHVQNSLDCPADGSSNPPGSEPLCVTAGAAVILDRRIWHTRSPNSSGRTRKVIWYGYSYRWLRSKDEMTVDHLYSTLTPIQRQLLGDSTSANSAYDPKQDDVPLRSWLLENDPDQFTDSPHGHAPSRPPAGGNRGKNIGRN